VWVGLALFLRGDRSSSSFSHEMESVLLVCCCHDGQVSQSVYCEASQWHKPLTRPAGFLSYTQYWIQVQGKANRESMNPAGRYSTPAEGEHYQVQPKRAGGDQKLAIHAVCG